MKNLIKAILMVGVLFVGSSSAGAAPMNDIKGEPGPRAFYPHAEFQDLSL